MTSRSSAPTPRKDTAGKWGFVFDSVHPNADGTRRQVRRRGFPTKAAAQVALDKARADDAARYAPPAGALTVGDVFDQFIRAKELAGRSPNTLAQLRWVAAIVKERWGGWAAERLTGDHLEGAYLEMLSGGRRQYRRGHGTETTDKPMSRRSVEVVHQRVKMAFQYAVNRGQLVRNPAALVEVGGRSERAARPYWTPQQVGTFLAFVADSGDLPVGLVDVLVDTGARIGEVMGLRWSNVDLEPGTVSITGQLVSDPTDSKRLTYGPTKQPRSKSTIGLHPATVAALKARKAAQAADRLKMGKGWPTTGVAVDLVFTWPDGRAMHPKTVSKIIARLGVDSGLPRLTAHGLRHSFATAALSARVPVEVVAARLGNTPRIVQTTYQHVIAADDAATALVVGDLYRVGSSS